MSKLGLEGWVHVCLQFFETCRRLRRCCVKKTMELAKKGVSKKTGKPTFTGCKESLKKAQAYTGRFASQAPSVRTLDWQFKLSMAADLRLQRWRLHETSSCTRKRIQITISWLTSPLTYGWMQGRNIINPPTCCMLNCCGGWTPLKAMCATCWFSSGAVGRQLQRQGRCVLATTWHAPAHMPNA